ncbi:tyrosine-type recombinase/integrase, partial [Caballeronia glebae]|uniref:tyrosine-type recombinase/integrase n=1 Tax=Caballeronia glebae TaxID=1777143 RepID=UPI0038BD7373
MRDHALIGPWVRRFLLEYLVTDRNLARNTQASYRDTLVLFLPYLSRACGKPVDRLAIDDLSPSMLRSFLAYVEEKRGCSCTTRNLRLSAIHSLAKYIGTHSPEHLAWYSTVRAVPFKKTAKSTLNYLDKPEIDVLLKTPDLCAPLGRRDYALLLFLYNTGARADEAAHPTVGDIAWGSTPAIRLRGKGNKLRWCPIWDRTADVLKPLVRGRSAEDFVFLNRLGRPLTRFGIYSLVRRAVVQASQTLPSLTQKPIGPHCIRHSCAVHMLRSGVDINTIRAWLG